MAANTNIMQRRFTSPSTVDGMSMRPCLVHVPTGEVVKNYAQLSRIVKNLGWRVFIDVSSNIWSAWYLPVEDISLFQILSLPHPHISLATNNQLVTVMQAFGSNVFNMSYAHVRHLNLLEAYSDFQKTLRLRATGKEILTVQALTRVLSQHGWIKEGDNQFVKLESDESLIYLVNVMRIPTVENLNQMSNMDLEYIVLITDDIFYLQNSTRVQHPRRRQDYKPSKIPTSNNPTKALQYFWRTGTQITDDTYLQTTERTSQTVASTRFTIETTTDRDMAAKTFSQTSTKKIASHVTDTAIPQNAAKKSGKATVDPPHEGNKEQINTIG